jgi:hypothetical protein
MEEVESQTVTVAVVERSSECETRDTLREESPLGLRMHTSTSTYLVLLELGDMSLAPFDAIICNDCIPWAW